jgi:hypothetical protein
MQRDQEGSERGSFQRKAFSLSLLINHTFSAFHEPPHSSRPHACLGEPFIPRAPDDIIAPLHGSLASDSPALL